METIQEESLTFPSTNQLTYSSGQLSHAPVDAKFTKFEETADKFTKFEDMADKFTKFEEMADRILNKSEEKKNICSPAFYNKPKNQTKVNHIAEIHSQNMNYSSPKVKQNSKFHQSNRKLKKDSTDSPGLLSLFQNMHIRGWSNEVMTGD